MNIKIIAVAALALFSFGCANMSTISRTTTLPPLGAAIVERPGLLQGIFRKNPESGLAIHLDAPQRLVFSRNGIICAEPSPDALQAYAASQSLNFSTPSTASAELANALSSGAGSIGLRTQSITLMRDHLYRICEAAYSGLLTDFDVGQLFRRSQDLTLAVVAIEQLSGTVSAQQVAINSKAVNVPANLAATQAYLTIARETERSAKEASATAEANQSAQQKVVDTKQALVTSSTPGQDTAKLQEELGKEKMQLQADKDKAIDAQKNYTDARRITKKLEEKLEKAMLTDSDAPEVEMRPSVGGNSSGIDANTAQKLSMAVTHIVDTIVQKNHIIDSCISILIRFPDRSQASQEETTHEYEEKELEMQIDVAAKSIDDARREKTMGEFAIDALMKKKMRLEDEVAMIKNRKKDAHGLSTIRTQCIEVLKSGTIAPRVSPIAPK